MKIPDFLSKLNRGTKISLQLAIDSIAIVVCFFAAMLFRLESVDFASDPKIWIVVSATIVTTLVLAWNAGLYRALVRFVTGRILVSIGKSSLAASIVLFAVSYYLDAEVPNFVPPVFGVFLFVTIGGFRFGARAFFREPTRVLKQPVIVYGAGEAGRQLLNSLVHGPEYAPVALVDDNPSLRNLSIGGFKVVSPENIDRIASTTGARIVLLAIPSLERSKRLEIIRSLEEKRLRIMTIPGMADIISGKSKISELRTVTPNDLLGRQSVEPNLELLKKNVTDLVVMVTGAGGSIGSELCRQVLSHEPSKLVLYEVSEFALYTIDAELASVAKKMGCKTQIVPVLGSVQHERRLQVAIRSFGVQTIYHAAAYKHVPLVEENIVEGIRNNVFGTLAVASAAKDLGVKNFILISTDKAVRPTNVMGATKRIAELICQAQAKEVSRTVFSMVRFGNVLGSSGSVIPRFRSQIENGGPLTVTHTEITRYFMTIPEASQLVIQAGALAKGGDVFVLDMGEPVKIMDLAKTMVKLHGLKPYLIDNVSQISASKGDIPILVTGLRKGEKLYEELLIGQNPSPTAHSQIITASEISLPTDQLMAVLGRLMNACENFNLPEILLILKELPLDYAPTSDEISDLLWDPSSYDASNSERVSSNSFFLREILAEETQEVV